MLRVVRTCAFLFGLVLASWTSSAVASVITLELGGAASCSMANIDNCSFREQDYVRLSELTGFQSTGNSIFGLWSMRLRIDMSGQDILTTEASIRAGELEVPVVVSVHLAGDPTYLGMCGEFSGGSAGYLVIHSSDNSTVTFLCAPEENPLVSHYLRDVAVLSEDILAQFWTPHGWPGQLRHPDVFRGLVLATTYIQRVEENRVPEPSTLLLGAIGLAGFAFSRRKLRTAGR